MTCGGRANDLVPFLLYLITPISTASYFHVILQIAVAHICYQTLSKIEICIKKMLLNKIR